MPGMRELKGRLKSINATGQLAGAMKTVSSAKLSKVNRLYGEYKAYGRKCTDILSRLGGAVSDVIPCGDNTAPVCYVVISSNRGLCGSFNSALLSFADDLMNESEERGEKFVTVCLGKKSVSFMSEHKREIFSKFALPDLPEFSLSKELAVYLIDGYKNGLFSKVVFVYQHFVNIMKQEPMSYTFLPLSDTEEKCDDSGMLFIPDKATVLRYATGECLISGVHSILLEAASGAQAATLMAMRDAYNNATETSAELEARINRMRQSSVTSGVIETYMPEETE